MADQDRFNAQQKWATKEMKLQQTQTMFNLKPDQTDDITDRDDADAGVRLAAIAILSLLAGLAFLAAVIGIGLAVHGAHP
ncbi:hypothetical protein ACMDCR_10565 [Labrys okinawensis]|uniref:hypothetical protein n=1 Tax=Labrys okinawensis TaxID=346911 RepID=UPI0039BC7280